MDIGIALTARTPAPELLAMARAADAAGFGFAVLEPADDETASLDPWTTALWLAGGTERLTVLVPRATATGDGSEPGAPVAAVLEKAATTAGALTDGRVQSVEPFWRVVEPEHLPVSDADGARPVAGRAREGAQVRRLADPRGSTTPRWRSAAALSRRRPDIDYDGVPASLAPRSIEPGDAGHAARASTYMRGGDPGLVLRPSTPGEVADALAFAARHREVPLGIRSGGHGISGRSTNHGGLVIDLADMNEITVLDRASRTFRAGPGATWKQVAAAIGPHGWAITSGDYGGVGIGGLATAGGIGLLGRRQGLTIDRLTAVEMVLADGTPVRASHDENPDLFWGVRGAGANLGVVTAFELRAGAVGQVGWAQLAFAVDDLAQALTTFGEIASAAPRDVTLFLVTGPPRGDRYVIQLYGVVDSADPDTIIAHLGPFTRIGPLVQQQVALVDYADVVGMAPDRGADGHHGSARSALVAAITPEVARAATDLVDGGSVHVFQLRTMGGAIADVAADATAFAYRDAGFSVAAMGRSPAAVDPGWAALEELAEGMYLSFDTRTDGSVVSRAFPPPTLSRLRDLKRHYDPTSLLRDNVPIAPAPLETR